MKRQNFVVNFENEHLSRLILDQSSCVSLKQCTHHLALHPYHLTNVNDSLKTILNKGIAKFDKTLGGILLGYQNLALISTTGAVNNDACFIHVNISADFFLFEPEVGKKMTGVVNKKSEDHVGCLVHEVFNVSLPKPPEDDNWMGSLVQIGHEILFQINFIDLKGRLPYIRASFISIISDLDSGFSTGEDTTFKQSKKKLKSQKIIFTSENEETVDNVEIKKKKKRKSNEEFSANGTNSDELIEAQEIGGTENIYIEEKSKKNKRKRKRGDDYNATTSLEESASILETSTDTKHKKHKRRKIKLELNDTIKQEINSSLDHSQNSETEQLKTSHKHKRKHNVY